MIHMIQQLTGQTLRRAAMPALSRFSLNWQKNPQNTPLDLCQIAAAQSYVAASHSRSFPMIEFRTIMRIMSLAARVNNVRSRAVVRPDQRRYK
jgi:hypothetical protein